MRISALRAEGSSISTEMNREDIDPVQNQLGSEWSIIAENVHQRVVNYKVPFCGKTSLITKSIKLTQCGFFDTETTGLSNSSGTIIFIFGLGSIEDDEFIVRQIFLENFSGEKAFLENVERLIAKYSILVSFNGLAFDKRILENRLIFDGRTPYEHQHIDLLHLSRKIWASGLPDCRLKTLEKEVLGIDRGKDLDGAEIPDLYFRFQFSGFIGQLKECFDHNLWDVVTLAHLFGKIESVLLGEDLGPFDHFGVGKILQNNNDEKASVFFLRGFKQGDVRCGTELALNYKRTGFVDKSVLIWTELFHQHSDFSSAIELAKYYEHVVHDYGRAIYYIEPFMKSLNSIGPQLFNNLERRFNRLKRKIGFTEEKPH